MRVICPMCQGFRVETKFPVTYAAEHCRDCRMTLFEAGDAEDWETTVEKPEEETRQSMMRRLDRNALWREAKKKP